MPHKKNTLLEKNSDRTRIALLRRVARALGGKETGMIDRIILENFNSLREVDLSLEFLDALRVLQGIGNEFTISEILDGKPLFIWSTYAEGPAERMRPAEAARGVAA